MSTSATPSGRRSAEKPSPNPPERSPMAAPDLRGLIQAGFDILTTAVDKATKKITAQLGSVVGKTTDSDGAEWWQHYGLASRPPKPEAGKQAAQAVVLRTGDHDICVASQDLRGLELYGSIDHGEACP